MRKITALAILGLALTPASMAYAGQSPEPGAILWQPTNPSAAGVSSTRPFAHWTNLSGVAGASSPAPTVTSSQSLVGFGSFGTAGKRYIIRDPGSGGRLFWVPADNPAASPTVLGNSGLGTYYLAGVADFNADGIDDLVFRDDASGTNTVWHMNANGSIASTKQIAMLPDPNWSLVGVGNLNSSGVPDLVWHHKTNGALYYWHLTNAGATYNYSSFGPIGTYSPTNYKFKYAGDFDGDGDADLLAQSLPGENAKIFKLQNSAISGSPINVTAIGQIGGISGSGTTKFTPEVLVGLPVGTAMPLSHGGSNYKLAKDLGTITANTNIIATSEALHGGNIDGDSYFKFTLTQPLQVAIGLGSGSVYGFGSNENGNFSWGQIGSPNPSNPDAGKTTGVFNLNAGTYYYRVRSVLPSAQPSQIVDFTFSISAAAPGLATAITPGDGDAGIYSGGVKMGPYTYFLAKGGESGLWRTDGSAAGTTRVADLRVNSGDIAVLNNTLYFSARDTDANGYQLWKSNGTTAGTAMVKQINSNGSSNPNGFTAFNGSIYFAADDGTNGRELWKSNGTSTGTTMVANINTTTSNGTPGSSSPADLLEFSGHLVFTANDGSGREIWRLSPAGVATAVTNLPGSGDPRDLTVAGSNLFASAALDGQDGTNGANKNIELLRVSNSWGVATYDILSGGDLPATRLKVDQ